MIPVKTYTLLGPYSSLVHAH